MSIFSRLTIALKALRQLGFQPLALNALYRFGLATGHYERVTSPQSTVETGQMKAVLPLPAGDKLLAVLGNDGRAALLNEADEITSGKVRLFGGEPVELKLSVPGTLRHWTAYETSKEPIPYALLPVPDIKFVWEPARFGWAFTLGRAYHLSGDEKYAEAFWRYFESFTDANPACFGPHWMSGQEVALRLMAFVWAGQVFEAALASTPERKNRLAASVAVHASRIPPTLIYARSQQNNHLLTEAAGLLTAGLALPDHPDSTRWRNLGWRWLNKGLQAQIDSSGEYSQHSTNYQRLMLQVALWTNSLAKKFDLRWPRQTLEAIGRSIHWLLALMDSESGRTPNLGANDGAYIFPLTVLPFADYRPVLHAAGRAFLDYELPRGAWDEMSLWFGIQTGGPRSISLPRYPGGHIYGRQSWASLRTAEFTSRPSHADQLHLDLWWRGLNVALDPGTYLYNAPAPWDNSLTTTLVHNTVAINGRDQMTRAGRFLYLDWINAYRENKPESDPAILQRMEGRHWGYHKEHVRHERTVTTYADGHWTVVDDLNILSLLLNGPHVMIRLHWLLPDWEWQMTPLPEQVEAAGCNLQILSPHGWMTVRMATDPLIAEIAGLNNAFKIGLVRAGEVLTGNVEPFPSDGWFSPTYGVRIPALSLSMEVETTTNTSLMTEFIFPK